MAKPKKRPPPRDADGKHRLRKVERSGTGRGTTQSPAPASEQYLEARTGGVRSAETASRRRCYPKGTLWARPRTKNSSLRRASGLGELLLREFQRAAVFADGADYVGRETVRNRRLDFDGYLHVCHKQGNEMLNHFLRNLA